MYYTHIQAELNHEIYIETSTSIIIVHPFNWNNKNECDLWIINKSINTILKDISVPFSLKNINELILVLKDPYSIKTNKYYRNFIIGCCLGYPPSCSLVFAQEAQLHHTSPRKDRIFIKNSKFCITAYKDIPETINDCQSIISLWKDYYDLL